MMLMELLDIIVITNINIVNAMNQYLIVYHHDSTRCKPKLMLCDYSDALNSRVYNDFESFESSV